MTEHGKKYLEAAKLVDREQVYQPLEAVELAEADLRTSPSTPRSRRT